MTAESVRRTSIFLVVVFVLSPWTYMVSAQEPESVASLLRRATKVEVRCAPGETKIYRITVASQEQARELNARQRIKALIIETYEDDANGIFDVNKYREIKRLAASLPGGEPEAELKQAVARK